MTKERVVVLGGGTWGATLADRIGKNGHDVCIWEFIDAQAQALQKTRTLKNLPQLKLHEAVTVTSRMEEALKGRTALVSVVPSEFVRPTFKAVQKSGALASGAWAVSATKGIETDTLKRMSEVIAEEVPTLKDRVAVLSGPSHAEEVAMNVPTAVVSAGPEDLGERVQKLFNADRFRVYTGGDPIGVELGGALKNIYAIACGACDGLKLGDNTKAALMTRGLNEMCRVGIVQGAKLMTFFGLSGMGDMIVTCTSRYSRNRLLGEKIGQGKSLKKALQEMTMVAEGVRTTKSAFQLSQKLRVELPIVQELYRCLHEDKSAKESLHDLMTRPVANEMVHVEHLFKGHQGEVM